MSELPKWIQIVALLLAVLLLALATEHWRAGRVKVWAARHQATLHWPVDLALHPELPAAAFAARFEVQGAQRWGAAMQGQVDGRSAWVLEYEATPGALKAGRWYSLCLVQIGDDANEAQAKLESRRRAGAAHLAASGGWLAERREGVMTVHILNQWF